MYKSVATSYSSRSVDVESSFLKGAPQSSTPITASRVDFTKTPLSERGPAYAVVLDGVLTPEECAQFISYAEASSTTHTNAESSDSVERGWTTALVNAGPGRETHAPEYRNSQRIIWDGQEMMDRLWARVIQAQGVKEDLEWLDATGGGATKAWTASVLGGAARKSKWREPEKWKFTRLNERMRFLRYEPGMFFREHCDGAYVHQPTQEKSFYTLHLYLNDSVEGRAPEPFTCSSEDENKTSWLDAINPLKSKSTTAKKAKADSTNPEQEDLSGGATTFYTDNMRASMDVFPKAGRVLIFQHRSLLHAGGDVHAGVKYTMRTDLMYEQIEEDDA